MTGYLRLESLRFKGPSKDAGVRFYPGVNVICGASDTGKSFLAEAIDFMLGGSELKDLPERAGYNAIELRLACTDGTSWSLERAMSGGDFALREGNTVEKLRQSHAHGRTDNLSGYLLHKIGLLGRRILKSSAKGTTNSLSFRNLARLVIVQEGEIQHKGSPFWGGQFTVKTAELATIKLLLTGMDDSAIVSASVEEPDTAGRISLIEELIADLQSEIVDMGEEREALEDQLDRLDTSAAEYRVSVAEAQRSLDKQLGLRRDLARRNTAISDRIEEIVELNARFALLGEHYDVDLKRLWAIQESGSLFAFVERTSCPLCGAGPDGQHVNDDCEGNVKVIVEAAAAEIGKILALQRDLKATVSDLGEEQDRLVVARDASDEELRHVDEEIRSTMAPKAEAVRAKFTDIVETRAAVQSSLSLFDRLEKPQRRRDELDERTSESTEKAKIAIGFSEAVAHQFSLKLERILKAWNFPGECRVHYDKDASDFVIDGKPRGSRGKGLRAITHAAISIALLEYCQEGHVSKVCG